METQERDAKASVLSGLQEELDANAKATANVMKAIEAGIIIVTTKARLTELEAEAAAGPKRFVQAPLRSTIHSHVRWEITARRRLSKRCLPCGVSSYYSVFRRIDKIPWHEHRTGYLQSSSILCFNSICSHITVIRFRKINVYLKWHIFKYTIAPFL